MPYVGRVVHRQRGKHIHAGERGAVHTDMPAVGTVLIRFGIVFDELLRVEFFLGSFYGDPFLDHDRAQYESAAEQNTEKG